MKDDFDLETANRRLRESAAAMHNQIMELTFLALKLVGYATHDDDCIINLHPHYQGCSCGLRKLINRTKAQDRRNDT